MADSPPLDAATLRAEAVTLREYFRTTPTTLLQGQPIADDYRAIFERTFALLDALAKAAAPRPVAEQEEK